MQIIVISSVHPEPTIGGEILLHRHLSGEILETEIYGTKPASFTYTSLIRRIIGRIGRGPFKKFGEDFWAAWAGRWVDAILPKNLQFTQNTIVLTVAHGDVFPAAMRFAKRNKLPLVSIFHDWWPDMPPAHGWARQILERQFRALYHVSDVALCVSEGMKQALGSHPYAEVLYPIPAVRAETPTTNPLQASIFKVAYFGNLATYGDMLHQALVVLKNSTNIQLEVRGTVPANKTTLWQQWQASGHCLPFAPRDELESWLNEASAFLIPMEFDPAMRRRMETSFPSKLTEFSQLGKPLIIWGPEYCSAVQWARHKNSALCVTDPDPMALEAALTKLADSPHEQSRLAHAAIQAATTEFDHKTLQTQFLSHLNYAVNKYR